MPFPNGSISSRLLIIATLLLIRTDIVSGQEGILDSLFTFNAGILKTNNALNIITRQSGYYFTYDSRLINSEKKTDLTFRNEKLGVILSNIIGRDSISFSVIDRYIIIAKTILPGNRSDTSSALLPGIPGYISGIIVDESTNDPLPYASIGLMNSGKGTVSNINGEFRLSIQEELRTDILVINYLGFLAREIPVSQALGNYFTIAMKRDFISIPEIIIRTQVPQEILNKSISLIKENFGNNPVMLTAFYREGVMKKSELQSYSEAVLQIYKSAYTGTLLNDQIRIVKSRKIENTDASDTLAVRLKAGLSTCLELDGVKNSFDFLSRQSMSEYSYRVTDIVSFDEEAAYVIDFVQREEIETPLYRGTMFINTSDFALLQADFELHPKYLSKMKDSFVSSSARGFTTWPQSVKYSVKYRKLDDRYLLYHVRGDLAFVSRQKRKFFNSQFNIFFELAVTNVITGEVSRFEREELAPIHSVFSKTINNYDPGFWGDQDFLKPEDNLILALRNMKVRLQEFSEKQD
jgi:hypothetical protein